MPRPRPSAIVATMPDNSKAIATKILIPMENKFSGRYRNKAPEVAKAVGTRYETHEPTSV